MGWKITNFDKEKWDENAKTLCYPGIREKFMQNKSLLETLLRTKGHKLVESAKDKVWGTGIVLSRDDWHDSTLWESQGILGEMLMEIRDTYLSNHPHVQVQPLNYRKKLPHGGSPGRFGNNPTLSMDRESLSHSRSNPDFSELSDTPASSLASDQNMQMQHSSSHPNLELLQRQCTSSDSLSDSREISVSSSLRAVPMDDTELSLAAQTTLNPSSPAPCAHESDAITSRTQASLLSLSQTPYGHPVTTPGILLPSQIDGNSGQGESNN